MNSTDNERHILFERGEEDRKILAHILFQPDISLPSCCFHAQQAVEKYMKAVLNKNNIKFPFTHDLIEIWHILKDNNFELPILYDDLKKLNPFAVKARYDEPPEIDATREEVKEIVDLMSDWCKKHIHD